MAEGCVWRGFVADAPSGLLVACCSCGWRSRPCATAGLAGAAVDRHVRAAVTDPTGGDDDAE